MHCPESIHDRARHVLLQTANAIMSANGLVALTHLERDTLVAMAEYAGARSCDIAALDTVIPADLTQVLAEQPDAFGDIAITLWCMSSMVGGTLCADKLAVMREVAKRAGTRLPLLDDLDKLRRNRDARWPRIRIFRRILRDLFGMGLLEVTIRTGLAYTGLFFRSIRREYQNLASLPSDTYGAQLYRFYQQNQIPLPGAYKSYPVRLAAAHDARHVLAGFDTSYEGELGIAAFEAGCSNAPMLDFLATVMLHAHLGIKIDPTVAPATGMFEPHAFFQQLRRGNAMPATMSYADWDFWPYIETPLYEVRDEFCVRPDGNLAVALGSDARDAQSTPLATAA